MASESELHLQKDFYESFLMRVDRSLTMEQVQTNFTDGIVNGNILEFKVSIRDRNAVLFQVVKYLSTIRIKGQAIPANILLFSCNDTRCYVYKSQDYLTDIEKVYNGPASKGNGGFVCNDALEDIDYSTMLGQSRLIELLKTKQFTKIHIDENCIVGWAKRFYTEKPNARKQDFIGDNTGKIRVLGEIRQPLLFKDYILPYTQASNKKFEYLMDKLNDTLQKKNLGAYYTHPIYAMKSLELLRKAIERVPDSNDYVIIDRCAGTGNLERFMTDEELSHTIVSTIEYYEYKVLQETFGDKVRQIIPPVEEKDTFNAGLVRGADALSEEFVTNPVILQYIQDPNCTIILFENPPYSETTSAEHQRQGASKKSSEWKKSYLVSKMKEDIKSRGLKHTVTNDLGNIFIWSAFKYYLRQPTDSYIVYSPVKYWKAQHLVDKKFIDGYAFNRKHFHTNTEACIMVALWSNEDCVCERLTLKAYDITENALCYQGELSVNKIHRTFSQVYYDKRPIPQDESIGIFCALDGTEKTNKKQITNKQAARGYSILGYMVAHSSGFDNPDLDSSLLVAGRYDAHGFYLRRDNFMEKMPLFAATRFYAYYRKWTGRARIMKSGDGNEKFFNDVNNGTACSFLNKCLLFTCLETQNHMREFVGSDGYHYKNNFTLDTTNGETIAASLVASMNKTNEELLLISQWNKVLKEAKRTDEYNSDLNYGIYQIKKEIDVDLEDENGKKYPKYSSLRGNLNTLKVLLSDYYTKEILPLLYEYEFLK